MDQSLQLCAVLAFKWILWRATRSPVIRVKARVDVYIKLHVDKKA